MMTNSRSSLVLALAFIGSAATLIYVIQKTDLIIGIVQLLVLLSGILVAGAVNAFQRFTEGNFKVTRENLRVAEAAIRELRASVRQTRSTAAVPQLPRAKWDLTSAQLLSADKSLALAKLRIELEKQLRRIASETDIDISTRPVGLVTILRELIGRDVLPRELEAPLRQVARVCNQAIHGTVVPDPVATRTVSLGSEIWEYLNGVHPSGSKYSGTLSSTVSRYSETSPGNDYDEDDVT